MLAYGSQEKTVSFFLQSTTNPLFLVASLVFTNLNRYQTNVLNKTFIAVKFEY